jgi:hypothetical protein
LRKLASKISENKTEPSGSLGETPKVQAEWAYRQGPLLPDSKSENKMPDVDPQDRHPALQSMCSKD